MGLNLKYQGQQQQQPNQNSQPQDNYSTTNPLYGLGGLSSLNFQDERQDDLTRFQLDLSQTKADISHWLNGDIPSEDPKTGKVTWEKNTDENLKVLNNFGIREVMRIINMYLTKDVILSNLKEEMINKMCSRIGEEINDLFFTKYDEIGLESGKGMKNYSSIVVTLSDIIYVTLMRAKDGKERISVTENRNVNQNEIIGMPGTPQRSGLFGRFGRRG